MTGPDPLHYGWWLASRASGIVALGLVTLSVGLGLTMAGRIWRRRGLAKRLRTLHEHAALIGLGAIGVHGLTLLGDRWLHAQPVNLLVPFTLGYRPLLTGLGVIAGELAALLGLSFYVRRRIGSRAWRRAHRLTVLVWALGVVHALGAGTDAHTLWLRAVVLITSVPIVALFARRVATRPSPSRPSVQAAEAAR
jgi:methionine sulfoxide reductase heme-binding subunit